MYWTPGWGIIASTVSGIVGVGGTLLGTYLAQRQSRWLYQQQSDDKHRIEQRESVLELLEIAGRLRPANLEYATAVDNEVKDPALVGPGPVREAHEKAVEQANKVIIAYRRSRLIITDPAIVASLEAAILRFEALKNERNLVHHDYKNDEDPVTNGFRRYQLAFDHALEDLQHTTRDSLQGVAPVPVKDRWWRRRNR